MRYEEMILGQIRCEEALQVVPACRLCYMKTAPNCQNTRPTRYTPQYKTSIKGPFHFRQNNRVLLLSQNVNFSLSGHYNQGDADVVIEKSSLPIFCNDLVLAQCNVACICLALPCLADHQFQVRECILLGSSPNSYQKKID